MNPLAPATMAQGKIDRYVPPDIFTPGGAMVAMLSSSAVYVGATLNGATAFQNLGTTGNTTSVTFTFMGAEAAGGSAVGVRWNNFAQQGIFAYIDSSGPTLRIYEMSSGWVYVQDANISLTLTDEKSYTLTLADDGSVVTASITDDVGVQTCNLTTSLNTGNTETMFGWIGTTADYVFDAYITGVSASQTATVATPEITPAAGAYTFAQSVYLSSTPGATIYYTTNGTTPTSASTPYAGPVSVTASQTIKAIGILAGWTDSAVATEVYTIVAWTMEAGSIDGNSAGTFTLTGNDYGTLSSSLFFASTWNAATAYSDLGTSDNGVSATFVYQGPEAGGGAAVGLRWDDSTQEGDFAFLDTSVSPPVIKLYETTAGWSSGSSVTSGDLTLTVGNSYTLTIFDNGTTVTATLTDDDGAKTCTFTPTVSSANTEVMIGWVGTTANYTFSAMLTNVTASPWTTVATPIIFPPGGTHALAQTVSITTYTAGADIYYTTDGSPPTTASTLYTAPIAVSTSQTIRAIAVKTSWTDSPEADAEFVIGAFLAFTGTGDDGGILWRAAVCTSESGLATGAAPYTLAARVITTATPVDLGLLVVYGTSAIYQQPSLGIAPTGAAYAGTGSSASIAGTTPINDGKEHSIVAKYDGTRLSLYVDGDLDAGPTAYAVNATPAGNGITLGADSPSLAQNGYSGILKDVRIYTTNLGDAQIATLAAGDEDTSVGSPLHWWKCTEGNGTTLNDDGTGGNTATFAAAPKDPLWTDMLPAHWYKFNEGTGTNEADAGQATAINLTTVPDWDTTGLPYIAGGNPAAAKLNIVGSAHDSITYGGNLLGTATQWTILGWINYDDATGSGKASLLCGATDSDNLRVYIDTATGLLYAGRDNTSDYIVSSNPIAPNEWHHLALVFDAGDIDIYIDGQLDNSGTMTGSLSAAASFKTSDDFFGDYWQGALDDLRVYWRLLSDDEIDVIFRGGMALAFYDSFTDSDGTALALHSPDIDVVGNGWQWTGGTPTIYNPGVLQDDNSGTSLFLNVDVEATEVIARVTFLSPALTVDNFIAAIYGRSQDSSNQWRVEAKSIPGEYVVYLVETVSGSDTVRDSQTFTYSTNTVYTLTIKCLGNSISGVLTDGTTSVMVAYTSADFLGETVVGIRPHHDATWQQFTYDDFTVYRA